MYIDNNAKLKERLLRADVKLGIKLKKSELSEFERINNVSLPKDLSSYLLDINGMQEGQLEGLTHLWSLNRYKSIPEYFDLNAINLSAEKIPDTWENLIDTTQGSAKNIDWVIENPNKYFLIGNYNIEGSFWAIDLSPSTSCNNSIISIYPHINAYHKVAANMSEFIYNYLKKSLDSLI